MKLESNKNSVKKAVGIFSGGLDSWLSALLIQKQGFDVYLLHFVSPYFGYSGQKLEDVKRRVEEKGMHFIVIPFGQDYIDKVVKTPKYGIGTAVNACVDCHAYMLRTAKKKMEELSADFVFSGEVLGQRPMSQRKEALNAVEKESGLKGYLVRPLSGRILKATIPEEKGILDREMLMDISGRGRKRQVELAKEFNFTDYPQPAGGCKFTDPNLVKRFNAMMSINKNVAWLDLELLKFGRHFNLNDGFYFILTRDETELAKLYSYSRLGIIIEPKTTPGATGLLLNYNDPTDDSLYECKLKTAGEIIARYSKDFQLGKKDVEIIYVKDEQEFKQEALSPILEPELDTYRL
jgi:tRNA-uridine 2-sulfurtransferase